MKILRKSRLLAVLALIVIAGLSITGFMMTRKTVNADATAVFEMEGTSIRLSEGTTGLRFVAEVDSATKEAVLSDEKKSFGALIVPEDFFDTYGVSKNSENLIEDFETASATINHKENLTVSTEANGNGNYEIAYSITNVKYYNLARDFYGIVYIVTDNAGAKTYEFATANDKAVRNVLYTASAVYSEMANELSSAELKIVEDFIVKSSYMKANPDATEEDLDRETQGVTVEDAFDIVLKETEKTIDKAENSFAIEFDGAGYSVDLYKFFVSSDENVATVDSNGTVTLVGRGQATITVSIMGKTLTLNLTVMDGVEDYINAIGTVTADSADAIKNVRTMYDALSAEDKAKVSNYATLLSAEDAIKSIAKTATAGDTTVSTFKANIDSYVNGIIATKDDTFFGKLTTFATTERNIETAYAGLTAIEYYAVTEDYELYTNAKASYKVINLTNSNVEAYEYSGNKFSSLGENTNTFSDSYGRFALISDTSGSAERNFVFKVNAGDLTGYTDVKIGAFNGMKGLLNIFLVGAGADNGVKIGENFTHAAGNGLEFATLTVAQLKDYALRFNAGSASTNGHIWVAPVVVYKSLTTNVIAVIKAINALDTPVATDEYLNSITAVQSLYGALSDNEKALVYNYEVLTAKITVLDELVGDFTSEKVTAIINKASAVVADGAITLTNVKLADEIKGLESNLSAIEKYALNRSDDYAPYKALADAVLVFGSDYVVGETNATLKTGNGTNGGGLASGNDYGIRVTADETYNESSIYGKFGCLEKASGGFFTSLGLEFTAEQSNALTEKGYKNITFAIATIDGPSTITVRNGISSGFKTYHSGLNIKKTADNLEDSAWTTMTFDIYDFCVREVYWFNADYTGAFNYYISAIILTK